MMKMTGKRIKKGSCCFLLLIAMLLVTVSVYREKSNEKALAYAEKKSEVTIKQGAQKTRKNYKIAIDAGHQQHANLAVEPVGPGASVKKAKVAGGATGTASKVPEYQLTLRVAKKLAQILKSKGYQVYMVRTSNNVNISNRQRAIRANRSGADVYLRIHADASGSSSVRGASMLYPSAQNRYVGRLSKSSKRLSQCILKKYCKKTGIKSRGLVPRDDLTGTNWSKVPVTLIEMGFLTNRSEDYFMQKSANQSKMAWGIAEGIDDYFGF